MMKDTQPWNQGAPSLLRPPPIPRSFETYVGILEIRAKQRLGIGCNDLFTNGIDDVAIMQAWEARTPIDLVITELRDKRGLDDRTEPWVS